MVRSLTFSLTGSLSTPIKSPKVGQSDMAIRPRFNIGSDKFSTPRQPPNTRLVASQTRLHPSQTDLCRRPCRVISGPFSFNTARRLCRDTCRDVLNIVSDALMGMSDVVCVDCGFWKGRAYILKAVCLYFANTCKMRSKL